MQQATALGRWSKFRNILSLFLIFSISLTIAGLRIDGMKNEAFQAIAHLWVGGLFGAYLKSKDAYYKYMGLFLSLVELACFIGGKISG